MEDDAKNYVNNIPSLFTEEIYKYINNLSELIFKMWSSNNGRLFVVGNGGSSANASHFANDLTYGIAINSHKVERYTRGIDVQCLSSDSSVLTCLANDIGYENIFSYQVMAKAHKDDLLVCLSGSGNSQNILNALTASKKIGCISFALLGYDGGKAKSMCTHPIHFECNDMQQTEDCHLIACHLISKKLRSMALQ